MRRGIGVLLRKDWSFRIVFGTCRKYADLACYLLCPAYRLSASVRSVIQGGGAVRRTPTPSFSLHRRRPMKDPYLLVPVGVYVFLPVRPAAGH